MDIPARYPLRALTVVAAGLIGAACAPRVPPHGDPVDIPPTERIADPLTLQFEVSATTFDGDLGIAAIVGDPSVKRVGDVLHMAYNCFAVNRTPQGGEACLAESRDDGDSWDDIPSALEPDGAVLAPGAWDTHHETPELFVNGAETQIYFIGYVDEADDNVAGFLNAPVSIGRATSSDGVHFTKESEPVLVPTQHGDDDHGMTSPTVLLRPDGSLLMLYTGMCFEPACASQPVKLLAATSNDGGATWTKRAEPIIENPSIAYAADGIAETTVVELPDGRFLLLFSTLDGDAPNAIGLAVADDPLGPYTFADRPILSPGSGGGFGDKGIVAPSALVEGTRLRVWFHGFTSDNSIRIAYAEASLAP